MIVENIFGVLCVTDIADAEGWYARLFGRKADAVPMASLREWHEGNAGVQVLEQPDRAGRCYVTLIVDDLDAAHIELADRGLTLGDRQAGDVAGIAQIDDPDGNTITVAQRTAR